MSGLINFIKGLFSAIFGIFGGKKKAEGAIQPAAKKGGSGFYLELDEAKGEAPAKSAAPAATANGATAEAKPVEAASAKSSRKEKLAALAEGSKPATASTPAPAKAPTATTTVATAPKPVEKFEPETAFASKYLVTNGSNGRRRPGANMSPYLDMARKMKG
jgi:hypothetical protein